VIIREEGTIGPTVLLLASENVKIQLAAVRLLRSLSVNEENQQAIADENGIPPLINLLESPFAKLQLNAAATLWNLSVNDDNKRKIAKEGAIRPLIFLLDSNNIKVQNEACGALRNLSFNDKNQRLIGKDGGITLLLDLLKSDDENLKRNSAITLNNLTSANEENKRRLRKEGGVELLISVLLANDINVLGFDPEKELQKRPRPDGFKGSATVTGNGSEDSAVSLTTEVFDTVVWNDIKIEKKIGSGAYGDVYKARYHGYPIAVKIIKESLSAEETKREKILEEIKIMSMLKHPNVVGLVGCCLSPDHQVAIVTEFAARGNLKDSLKEIKSLPQRLKLAKDIVAGLNWMHANNIIHRDLKLANLLVTEDMQIKITDFGLSLHWYEGIVCHHFKGNVKYSSPEILRARADKNITIYAYCPQTDVYSFGLMLWELVTVMPLFPGVKGKQNITQHVLAGNRPEIYEEWPKSLKTLLALCWHEDPNRRPLFREIQDKFDRVIIDVMCFGRDTPVLLADGRFKPVQDIAVGDLVLGDDGRTPRKVTRTTRGVDRMARVELVGERDSGFVCNMSHLLSCKLSSHASFRVRKQQASVQLAVTDAEAGRAIVGGVDDNVVSSIAMVERPVSSWLAAHTIVVALGGDVSVSENNANKIANFVQPFRTLGDAVRAVSDTLHLGLSGDAVEAVCVRSLVPKRALHGRAASVAVPLAAHNVAPLRLAFDHAQIAAIKMSLCEMLKLPGSPTYFDETVDVAVRDVLDATKVSPVARKSLLSFHAPVETFAGGKSPAELPIDPYALGFWLGAGGQAGSSSFSIATRDPEVVEFFKSYTTQLGLQLVDHGNFRYAISAPKAVLDFINEVDNKKRVPVEFMCGSVETRRRLLAGMLDADGSLEHGNVFDLALKLEPLLEDFEFVARSLGLSVTRISPMQKRGVSFGEYSRCRMAGDTAQLPTLVQRKKAVESIGAKCVGRASIKITVLESAEFFGFTVGGNGRVVVGNAHIVAHNCPDPTGRRICKKLWKGCELKKVTYEEFEEAFLEKTRLNLKLIRHIHLKCFDEESSQVLTSAGFMFQSDLLAHVAWERADPARDGTAVRVTDWRGLKVASYDERSARIVFATPHALVVNAAGGSVIEIGDKRDEVSIVATGNHELYVRRDDAPSYAKVALDALLESDTRSVRVLAHASNGARVGDAIGAIDGEPDAKKLRAAERAVVADGDGGAAGAAALAERLGLRTAAQVEAFLRVYGESLVGDAAQLDAHAMRWHDFDELLLLLDKCAARAVLAGMGAADGELRTPSATVRDRCVRLGLVAGYSATFARDDNVWRVRLADAVEPTIRLDGSGGGGVVPQRRETTGRTWCVDMSSPADASGRRVSDGFVVVRRAQRVLNSAGEWEIVSASRPTIQGNCLCAVICDNFDDTITLERFCNAVNWFGPMYPVEKFLERIRDLLQKKWFHGFVNSNKAAQLLKTRWSSTKQQYYLYRFSLSTPGCFALTFIEEDGTIVHKRISHSFNSSFVLMNNSPALDFLSIDQLHNGCLQDPNLLRAKKILPGSPFSSLFE
jgi:serine/threonine protein kinase